MPIVEPDVACREEAALTGQSELAQWLRRHDLEALESLLAAQGFDLESLATLTEADLIALGVDQMGLRRRLLLALSEHDAVVTSAATKKATKSWLSFGVPWAVVLSALAVVYGLNREDPCEVFVDHLMTLAKADYQQREGFDQAFLDRPEVQAMIQSAFSPLRKAARFACTSMDADDEAAERKAFLACFQQLRDLKGMESCIHQTLSPTTLRRVEQRAQDSGVTKELQATHELGELTSRLRRLQEIWGTKP